MTWEALGNGIFVHGECLEVMATFPDGYFDLVLCDLPYGSTQNAWDCPLDLNQLWAQYRRINRGAVVLFASQPFTSKLVLSNLTGFKHSWIWVKSAATGHLNARRSPLKAHEDILVFDNKVYFPQDLKLFGKRVKRGSNGTNFGASNTENLQEYINYPRDILDFAREGPRLHPTQKPVALYEYLIRTYSAEGQRVLDNTAGSGTLAVACEKAKRSWVCIESSAEYFTQATKRVVDHLALS